MNIQLPYNPNPHPPGQAPIPVWVGPTGPLYPPPPLQPQRANVTWTPIRPPPTLSIPHPNTTFPQFRLLPPELRLRIWSFTAPATRVIEIRSWGTGRYAPIKFTAHPHRLPTIFRICKESRSEALRLYKFVDIGVSSAQKLSSRTYVPWKYHPANPAADGPTAGSAPLPYGEPYPPCRVRINWERDIIYLGPEFQAAHLLSFLTATGAGFELPHLQRIALGHKLWAGSDDGRWDDLRACLWSLRRREGVREVIVVPDDERRALVDKWFYGKHEIELRDAQWKYRFFPAGQSRYTGAPGCQSGRGVVPAKDFVENLEEWFARLWRLPFPSPSTISGDESEMDDASSVSTLAVEEVVSKGLVTIGAESSRGREPPSVSVKSVWRDRSRMSDFKEGLWEIQEGLGDMRFWKTWTPPLETP